jgi:hypothetical protein
LLVNDNNRRPYNNDPMNTKLLKSKTAIRYTANLSAAAAGEVNGLAP